MCAGLLDGFRRVSTAVATGLLVTATTMAVAPAANADSSTVVVAQEATPASDGTCEPALLPMVKDDRTSPAQWTDPSSLMFGIGDEGKEVSPVDVGPIMANQEVWMIGSTQKAGVPWLGANTQHESFSAQTTGEVTLEVTSYSGPGDMIVLDGGSLGEAFGEEWFRAEGGVGAGSHTIGANTHVHPNWLFSSPGEYQVGITQTAVLNDGNSLSGTATLNFNVGGAGNADDGHFDFGPTIGCAGEPQEGTEPTVTGSNTDNSSGSTTEKSATSGSTAAGSTGAGNASAASAASGKRAVDGGPLAVTGFEPMTVVIGVLALGLAVMGAGVIYRQSRNS